MAVAYGDVYVAQIAMGASAQQTLDAFLEAEAHRAHRSSSPTATALRTASTCGSACGSRNSPWTAVTGRSIGTDRWLMAARNQKFVLDSTAPSIPLKTYAYNEIRYKMLSYTKPEEARRLLALAQEDVDQRWQVYTSLAERWPARSRRGQGETGSHVEAPAVGSLG